MKKILVIGGGVYQVPLIKRINELGFTSLCVDKNPSAPGFEHAAEYKVIDVTDKEECLAYAKEHSIDAVMTYGATLTLPTVAYIGEKLSLPALTPETAEISKSKFKIKKRLAEYGCNIKGEFFEMHSVEEASKHKFELPCVIKPCDGSGSKGVSLVYSENEIATAVKYAFDGARYGEFYAEGLVRGEEYSAEAFVAGDNVYVYAIVKTTFRREENGDVSYGHRTPSGLPEDKEALIADEVKKAIKALNITMASVNFDVILSDEDGKPYIIDCGIRIGQNLIASHFVPLSRGVSVIDNTIRLALGEKVDAEPKTNKCIATRLLIYKPGVIREIKPMDDVIGKNGVIDVVMRKGVGERQNEYKEKSDTCGWVIATGETPCEAEENAAKAKELLANYIIIE
ncbi:MAG: ATP-grasp domain-containing protein [Ruminococcaceae bacterium]|nr:ATP-grasp domain-containing protein [Oscillospiraceae bacterium]